MGDLVRLGDVGGHDEGALLGIGIERVGQCAEGFLAARGEHDLGAVVEERAGGGTADAAGSAGDDDGFEMKTLLHVV